MSKHGTTPEQRALIESAGRLGENPLADPLLTEAIGSARYRSVVLKRAFGDEAPQGRMLDITASTYKDHLYSRGNSAKPTENFDYILSVGVLRHLSDKGAHRFINRIVPMLSNIGQLAIVDFMRSPDNHWGANFMINNDRRSYVRDPQAYLDLMSQHFEEVRGDEISGVLQVPVVGDDFPQFVTVGSNPIGQ